MHPAIDAAVLRPDMRDALALARAHVPMHLHVSLYSYADAIRGPFPQPERIRHEPVEGDPPACADIFSDGSVLRGNCPAGRLGGAGIFVPCPAACRLARDDADNGSLAEFSHVRCGESSLSAFARVPGPLQ
eukprot:2452401-Alexandrium_andersonii.AAC.1